MKEKTLSDERKEFHDVVEGFYLEKDVKPAIKRLKEEIEKCPERAHITWMQKTSTYVGHYQMKKWFLEIIDKIFGDKLT